MRDTFDEGRHEMHEAFAELSALAYRGGATPAEVTALHCRYFDGSQKVRRAWRVALLLYVDDDDAPVASHDVAP